MSNSKRRLWAIGDCRPKRESFNIANMIKSDKSIHRFLYLGDVYDNGTIEDFANNYDPLFGSIRSITRPIPGNHEYHSNLVGYKKYWPEHRQFYSKEYGGWKLLFIDTNASMHRGSAQYEWTKKKLAEWGGPFILCHHHHRYSAGGHEDDPESQPILELLSKRTCVGLSGHTHNMQLFKRMDNYTQVVSGSGGGSPYAVDFEDERLAWGSNDYGAVRLDLCAGRMDLTFVKHDGIVLHQTTIKDHSRSIKMV